MQVAVLPKKENPFGPAQESERLEASRGEASEGEAFECFKHPRSQVVTRINGVMKHAPNATLAVDTDAGPTLTDLLPSLLRAAGLKGLVDDPLLSRPQASKITGASVATLLRLSQRGEGPAVTRLSPRRIGYRLSDL